MVHIEPGLELPRDFEGFGEEGFNPQWPNGARIAVSFVLNYEEGGERNVLDGDGQSEEYLWEKGASGGYRHTRYINSEQDFEYGSRSASWRLIRLFKEFGWNFTTYAVAVALSRNPKFAKALVRDGHEVAAHGLRWLDHSQYSLEEDKEYIKKCILLIKEVSGEMPVGAYFGRGTPQTHLLFPEVWNSVGAEFLWSSEVYNDDVPYWIDMPQEKDLPDSEKKGMLLIPYNYDCNDGKFHMSPGFGSSVAESYEKYLKNTFDCLYREGGKMMNIPLHTRIIGKPGRSEALRNFMKYVSEKEGVWVTTRRDIAKHMREKFPYKPNGAWIPSSESSVAITIKCIQYLKALTEIVIEIGKTSRLMPLRAYLLQIRWKSDWAPGDCVKMSGGPLKARWGTQPFRWHVGQRTDPKDLTASMLSSPVDGMEITSLVQQSRKRPRYLGGRTACTRCKTRKQKCDDEWPKCSNCQKAAVDCDKAYDDSSSAYTRSLEDKVAALQKQLLERNQTSQQSDQSPLDQERRPSHNALGEVVEALSHGNFEAPAYVGSSSGFSLALNLGSMVQASIWNEALPNRILPESRGHVGSPASLEATTRNITMEEIIANSAEPPDDEYGRKLLEAYCSQLHHRYPFLDMRDVWRLHSERLAWRARSIQSLSRAERFGIFKLYLVYAIGAMLLNLTEKKSSVCPESFYMTALQHIHAARESRTVQNIEAMTLLVVYHLRSASSHGIWYMVGLAMRTAIDLGLHRKDYEKGLDSLTIQARRRLFWTVYSLERIIAISLGRPFSLADRQIDVKLPCEDVRDDSVGEVGLAHAISLFKLRRIESRIQHSIYRADKALSSLQPKLEGLYSELRNWKSSIMEQLPPGVDRNYPMLHYNRAVRLLVQPFLSTLPPTDPYHQICLRAAGDICQAHKRLHQSLDYGHSFIAVQTVFVAGITLLHGLWTQGHAVWSVPMSNDVRACSLVLFAMSERAPWVAKYRDAFEILVDAAMEKLQSGETKLCETAAAQVQSNQMPNTEASDSAGTWRMVEELATWIDQGQGTPLWMPAFDDLQYL